MICLYSGTPGSGKSLHTASNIKARLALNKPVICNFQIDLAKVRHPEMFTYADNKTLSPDYLADYAYKYFDGKKVKEEEIFLIIDEAQLLFNAREWQAVNSSGWISFFTQHRKMGYHVILVAQFDRMIDRQIRLAGYGKGRFCHTSCPWSLLLPGNKRRVWNEKDYSFR